MSMRLVATCDECHCARPIDYRVAPQVRTLKMGVVTAGTTEFELSDAGWCWRSLSVEWHEPQRLERPVITFFDKYPEEDQLIGECLICSDCVIALAVLDHEMAKSRERLEAQLEKQIVKAETLCREDWSRKRLRDAGQHALHA